MQQLVQAFGQPFVHLLHVNSAAVLGPGQPPSEALPVEVWHHWAQGRVPGGGAGEPGLPEPDPASLGALITGSDLESLKRFVEKLATGLLLPQLEQRARALNQHVTNTRRGLKNQLKSFWNKSVGAAPEERSGVAKTYDLQSEEGQMHNLADLAMMLR